MPGLVVDELASASSFTNEAELQPPASPIVQNMKSELAGSRSPKSSLSPRSPLSPSSPKESSESSEKIIAQNHTLDNGCEAASGVPVNHGDGLDSTNPNVPVVNGIGGSGLQEVDGSMAEDLNVQQRDLGSEENKSSMVADSTAKDGAHELVLQWLREDIREDAQEASDGNEKMNSAGSEAVAHQNGSLQLCEEKQDAHVSDAAVAPDSREGEEATKAAANKAVRSSSPRKQMNVKQRQQAPTADSKRHSPQDSSKQHPPLANRRPSPHDSKRQQPSPGNKPHSAEDDKGTHEPPPAEGNKRNQSEEKAKGKMKEKPIRTAPPASASLRIPPGSPPIRVFVGSPGPMAPGSPSRMVPGSPSRMVLGSPSKLAPGSPGKLAPVSPLRPLKITVSREKSPNALPKASATKASPKFYDSTKSSPKSIAKSQLSLSDKNPESKPTRRKIFQSPPEKGKVQRKVREYLRNKKSRMGFGSTKAMGVAGDNEEDPALSDTENAGLANPDLGPFLVKLAKSALTSRDNPYKALDFATRAAKSFERSANGKPSLEFVMCLHIVAAIHCSIGQFEEAIPVLEHSLTVPDIEEGGLDHALAAFAGHMQLGDTFALLGRIESAIAAYHSGLELQRRFLGENHPQLGETCRYIAEAHLQAMQFNKAEELCQHALDIHREHSDPASLEEATDRRLMGLICNGKGEHEAALEHLVLASMSLISHGQDVEVAAVDTGIGDTYVALGRFDEAVFAYQKALTVFKAAKGENHPSVASVYVSLAELYMKTGKLREAKTYCESALRIYGKQGAGHPLDEVASGLAEIAALYEALNEQEQAIPLLQKALGILEAAPGQQNAAAGVEAQIGVLHYMMGKFMEACAAFRNSVSKLRASGEKNSSFLGIVLNQLGLACVQMHEIEAAAGIFEEARGILEEACGPHHPDTLAVYSNLAGAYDALGRLDDAIDVLEFVVEAREEKLGTATPEVDDERRRLAELLKEAGRSRAQRPNGTLELLMQSNAKQADSSRGEQSNVQGSGPVNVPKGIEVVAH